MERLKTSGQTSIPHISPSHVPPTSSNHIPLSPTSPFTPQTPKVEAFQVLGRESPPHSSIKYFFDDVEVDESEETATVNGIVELDQSVDVSEEELYPKPAAVSLMACSSYFYTCFFLFVAIVGVSF